MGLRHETVFGDAVVYVAQYQHRLSNLPFSYTQMTLAGEPLYTLLVLLGQRITTNSVFFFIITSLPISYGYSRLIRKYPHDPFMSVLLFCALGCMYFAMAGLRQAIAMGITMFAYSYAKERRIKPFLILCLIAWGFHNSAIVFLPVYFIINWKPSGKMWIAIAVAMLLGLSKNPIVLRIANIFASKEYMMDEEGLNYSMLLIQLAVLSFCYLFGNSRILKKLGDHNEYNSLLLMGFIGAIFQAFTPIKGEFFRVSLYYSSYLTFAVPMTIQREENPSNRALLNLGISAVLLIYLFTLSGMRGYKLFFAT